LLLIIYYKVKIEFLACKDTAFYLYNKAGREFFCPKSKKALI
jgi:hypothetical protein